MLDPVKNFAKVTPQTANDTATSITLASGDGAKLPDPNVSGDFNLVWYNFTDYPDPSDDPNKEIVRVTENTDDVLTVTRAQEGTSASTHNTANKVYKMILAVTKKMIDDIENTLDSKSSANIYNETPAGSVNGVNTVFTTAFAYEANTSRLYWNRVRQILGIDYTEISSTQIQLTTAPATGDAIRIDYIKVVSVNSGYLEFQDGSYVLLQDNSQLVLQN